MTSPVRDHPPSPSVSPSSMRLRESLVVGALKEEWPTDVASVICIGRRTILRYRIPNRYQDTGAPCPGVFEIVRIRTDAKSDEYGLTARQQAEEERTLELERKQQKRKEKEEKEQKEEGQQQQENGENNNNADQHNTTSTSDNSEDYETDVDTAPTLLQSEVVAAISSTSLNPVHPLPVFGSLHHFRVPLPSALSATEVPPEEAKKEQQQEENGEEQQKKATIVENDDANDQEPEFRATLPEVCAAGGIDGIDHHIMDLVSKMLKGHGAFMKEPKPLTDTITNPRYSSRDRVFAIALDGRSFAILSVSPPPLKPRKAQPIRVQFFGSENQNDDENNNNQNNNQERKPSAQEVEEQLRKDRERREQALNQDPPLFLRRTGSFPFEVSCAAMFILSYTDMLGLSDAYKVVGSAASPVVGPLPFPPDASMSRCMKELSRMSTMCLRQKHCCLCYSASTGNFVILEMTSLSSDDVSVASKAVVASGNIGAGWTSVVWAGPMCRGSDFARAGTHHRPQTTYRVRFFCYSASSGMSSMETITIPCETLASKKQTYHEQNPTNQSMMMSQQQMAASARLRSRRRSTITKLAPEESDSLLRQSSLIATPFSISGQRMCIMISVANDVAIMPLDSFDEEQAALMSCAAASSTSRLTATMTTPWARFYSVASRVSNEAWKKIETRHETSLKGSSTTTSHEEQQQQQNGEQSLRPPSPATLRKRRPTAVVAQAIMQEKVFSIPELEWSRFVTVHERYTDGGNYDEVLSYSASRGCAWISRIVYEDRWNKNALAQRLVEDLEEDKKEDERIRNEVDGLLEQSIKRMNEEDEMAKSIATASREKRRRSSAMQRRRSTRTPSTAGRRKSSVSPRSRKASTISGEEAAANDAETNNENVAAAEREQEFQQQDENEDPRYTTSRRRNRYGRSNTANNNNTSRAGSKRHMTPAERRAKGLQAVPPPSARNRQANYDRSAHHQNNNNNYRRGGSSPGNINNRQSRSPNNRPSWGAGPSRSRRYQSPNDNDRYYDEQHRDKSSSPHQYQRPGTSPHRTSSVPHRRRQIEDDHQDNHPQKHHNKQIGPFQQDRDGKWVRTQPQSSAFAPLLFPKNDGGSRPGTGGRTRMYQRPNSLPQLADDGSVLNPEDLPHLQGSSRPGTAPRSQARAAAKAVAERAASKQQMTPLQESQKRRNEAVVQSLEEIQKLGIGEEGGDEITEMTKIIGFMKKHDPNVKKKSKKKKNADGAEGDDDNDEDDDEDDDENGEEQGEEGEEKDDSLTARRRRRQTVDARVYKRAQEILESGVVDDQWIEAAFRHINRVGESRDDQKRSNAVFALHEEALPSMKFPLEDPEGTVKRPQGRPGWSYVINTHGELPPKNPRQLRAEAKQRRQAKQRESEAVVDEKYIEHYHINLHTREAFVKKAFKQIEKERTAEMIGRFSRKDPEHEHPLKFDEDVMERLAVFHVKHKADAVKKAEKTLDKEAADMLKQKELSGTQYQDMVHRLSEEYVERKKHHRDKARREVEKDMKNLFTPEIHHPARDGSSKKEIYVVKPDALSPEKRQQMANRLSTDYMSKRREHMEKLEKDMEEERFRHASPYSREVYERQNRHLSPDEQKELGERLAVPVDRVPAPR